MIGGSVIKGSGCVIRYTLHRSPHLTPQVTSCQCHVHTSCSLTSLRTWCIAENAHLSVKIGQGGGGEMELAALAEDPGRIPSTQPTTSYG